MLKKTIGMAGFTLAEVLITLGIIGVVAAMTMPTLINSTQGAQYKTAYKKALSVLSQAVVMNIALEDYDLSQTVAGTNPNTAADAGGDDDDDDDDGGLGQQSLYELFKNRMNVVKVAGGADFPTTAQPGDADYYKIVDIGNTNDKPDTSHFPAGSKGLAEVNSWVTANAGFGDKTYLFMNDGITFIFNNEQEECAAETATTNDNYCFGWIDVNGQKGPNRVVECDGTGDAADITGTGDDATCVVSNPTDIYPVMFYDQSIVPASAAGRAVLYAK